jgi:enamine deaminase RidA (YjgF/YER057c/UK114 family)
VFYPGLEEQDSEVLMIRAGFLFGIIALGIAGTVTLAQDVERNYVIDERGRERAFSRAVSTIGGEIVWLAGQTATVDSSGTSLIGDFEAQTREIFRILDERLAGFGGSLDDIVTMTVFISDTRFGDEFVEIRKQHFDNDRFPSSALVTVVGFARPEILIEIKATAVVDVEGS